jgi:hypothetical protein
MRESVAVVHDLVRHLRIFDRLEAAHRTAPLRWLASTDDVFRRVKPATPARHLVSYVVPVDRADGGVLLVDHRKAGLWRPPGGHVEPDERPAWTARREAGGAGAGRRPSPARRATGLPHRDPHGRPGRRAHRCEPVVHPRLLSPATAAGGPPRVPGRPVVVSGPRWLPRTGRASIRTCAASSPRSVGRPVQAGSIAVPRQVAGAWRVAGPGRSPGCGRSPGDRRLGMIGMATPFVRVKAIIPIGRTGWTCIACGRPPGPVNW